MDLHFSIIIPVYNRPNEVDELLESLSNQTFNIGFEVVIVEDGSVNKCDLIVKKYTEKLNIQYFFKANSGAGASRNFGMQKAAGNYYIVLDSDVILPSQYLQEVYNALQTNYTDAFGGPDAAHSSFTLLQKAINYSMTSWLTTGGIRGKKKAVGKFQPRSFNFGISKKAFLKTNGFSTLKAGEDIDLTFRLWQNNFKTQLLAKAFVYHKRRNTIKQFFKQTFAFGMARPLLNKRYPDTAKITYWFPSLFFLGFIISWLLFFIGYPYFLALYTFYFILIFIDAFLQNRNVLVAFISIVTTAVQFLGYGLGFLKSQFLGLKTK